MYLFLSLSQIKPCDGVLVFTVPDDIAVERLVKRGESSSRADDNEETIRKRMEVGCLPMMLIGS
jgi:adenylate kinase/UMP-CMP kinase